MHRFRRIVEEQFELGYYGHVDYASTEDMAVSERGILYDVLLMCKKRENEMREKAAKGGAITE